MGTPVPDDWPELEDTKWYCVTEDAYWDGSGAPGCRGTPIGRSSCCRTGAVIKSYIDGDNQCHFNTWLCVMFSPAQKKIVCIKGPYDTKVACQLEC